MSVEYKMAWGEIKSGLNSVFAETIFLPLYLAIPLGLGLGFLKSSKTWQNTKM